MRRYRPGGSGRRGGFGKTSSAVILPYPESRRVRRTPLHLRLELLSHIEGKLRAAQTDEQRHGDFNPELSRYVDWFDVVDGWERWERTA